MSVWASPFWTLCKYMFSVWGVKGSGGVGLQVVVESIQPSCGDPSMVLGSTPCSCLMFMLGLVRGLPRWAPAGRPGAPGGFRPEMMSGQVSGQVRTRRKGGRGNHTSLLQYAGSMIIHHQKKFNVPVKFLSREKYGNYHTFFSSPDWHLSRVLTGI